VYRARLQAGDVLCRVYALGTIHAYDVHGVRRAIERRVAAGSWEQGHFIIAMPGEDDYGYTSRVTGRA